MFVCLSRPRGVRAPAPCRSQGQGPPAEEVLRELLALHPAAVAGDEREAGVEEPLDGLHGREFAVAIEGEPVEVSGRESGAVEGDLTKLT